MTDSISGASELQSALIEAFGDRYQLSEKLGTGAYGVVFRAIDIRLDRDVAVKQVRLDGFHDADRAEEVKRRTQREARMTAKLRHPNIVAVHDIAQTATSTLIIMEYVDGRTLEDKLKEEDRLGLAETTELIAQTADALDHAHRQGVVHRDIKPANLMIDRDGRVKITDFGIAKAQSGSERTSNITSTGNVLGTPYYMSPEQARGEDELDGRSDLFSLGCVAYECLAGNKPFRGKSVVDVLLSIVNHDPPALDYDALELSPEIEVVLGKALAKKAAERFQTATELVEALRGLPAHEAAGPMPVVTPREDGARSSFDIELQGSLAERGLAEVIRDIQSREKTGILHLQQDAIAKRLYFLDGAIVFANSDVESDRLGQFLIQGGFIDAPIYERASRAMQKTRRRLGRTLVALGSLEEENLDRLVHDQIQRIIYSVFSWESGHYGFETIEKPVEDDIAREMPTEEIVLAAVRNMATESTIRNAIGDTRRILHHVDGSPIDTKNVTLTSSEGFVLSRVDGATSVAEIASISPLGENETLRCIYGLISAGILRLDEAKPKSSGRAKTAGPAVEPQPAPTTKHEPASAASESPQASEPTNPLELDPFFEEAAVKCASLAEANHYEALEVPRGATPEVIKKSYYTLAKRFHPDRHQSSSSHELKSRLERILTKLSEAYDVLSDPPSRLRYDDKLPRPQPVASVESEATDPECIPTVQTSPEVIAEAKYRAAMGYYKDEDYHQAVENVRDAVRLAPKKLVYHKLLGQALAKNPKWRKQAEGHLRRVLEAMPYDTECYLELATIYDEGGLVTRARKMYEQVLSLEPDHEVALAKLGYEHGAGKTAFLRKFLGKPSASSR